MKGQLSFVLNIYKMNSELFDQYTNLVYKIVQRMNYGYCDYDDLVQVGLMGLYQASLNYDHRRNVKFSTYATYYIIGEIKKEMRNARKIKLTREIYKLTRRLRKIDFNTSIEDLSKSLEVSKENLLVALAHIDTIVSLNKEYDNQELLSLVPDQPEIFNFELMHGLDKTMKEVITLKYYKGYTQEQIARILKLSQSKISRLEKEALAILRNSQ